MNSSQDLIVITLSPIEKSIGKGLITITKCGLTKQEREVHFSVCTITLKENLFLLNGLF